VCAWAWACGSALFAESSTPPGVALATPNIGSKVEDVGHAGKPAIAIDDPGLLFADIGVCADIESLPATEGGPDTRWSGLVNVPRRARLTTAKPDGALPEAG